MVWIKILKKGENNMIHLIGTNAGLVWRALSKAGRMSIKDLKKETKIRTEKDVYAAIGWLAKEDKIDLSEKEGEVFIWLI
jgi:hypothetical protein